MTIAASTRIYVTDHAMWRAAERFARFDTTTIEREVREALAAGRLTADRLSVGLARYGTSLYVWTEDGERVYALKVNRNDEDEWIVTTTMRRGM